MTYRDRTEAAERLADALIQRRGANPLVVAIPRGAVPMARIIADRLHGELDVVLTRKLHAPGNPEFAIGAVDETGWTFIADYARAAGASDDYVARESAAELETIRRRRVVYTPRRAPIDGRTGGHRRRRWARDRRHDVAALHAMRASGPTRLDPRGAGRLG